MQALKPTRYGWIAVVGLAAVVAIVALPALAQDGGGSANTITVSGLGTASGAPDVAYVEVAVNMVNEDFAAAYNETSAKVDSVLAALKEAGIADEDLQTTGINVWWEERYNPTTGEPTGRRVYNVTVSLRITVRDITKVESVLTTAVNNGANNVYGLSFGISDNDALKRTARELAVEDARAKAEHLAELLGVSLGDVVSVTEYDASQPIPYGLGGGGFARAEAAVSDISVQPGQLSVSAGVTITFAINK